MDSGNKHTAKPELTWQRELQKIETSICEGVQLPDLPSEKHNVFGRPVLHQKADDLSYISGLAMSGLRTGALLDEAVFENSIKQIRAAVRQHLPLTITIDKSGSESLTSVSVTPVLLPFNSAVQFVSSTIQEAIDFALIAHRVAELALIPVFHQVAVRQNGEVVAVTKKQLTNFLGNADDLVESPTPSQKMIFGPQRRRIPQWFNYDYPAQLGARKDEKSLSLESAANQAYFSGHLKEIISDCFEEFENTAGRKHDFYNTYQAEESSYLLITTGQDIEGIIPVIEELRKQKVKLGIVNINVISPFPSSQIGKLISNKKAVTILEPLDEQSNWLAGKVRELASGLKHTPQIITGIYANSLITEDILASGTNMASGKPEEYFLCGTAFTQSASAFPKHQVMLQAIERDYPHLKKLNLTVKKSTGNSGPAKPEYPISHIVRQYKDQGAPFTQLSRFKDSTALFYQDGNADEIVADPFQAIPSVPAASASLRTMTGTRVALPIINSSKCTACGSCMVECPHSAIPSVAIGVENLIKSGMDIASATGVQIIGLLPMVKNLSKAASKVISDLGEDNLPESIESILVPAFDNLTAQMKLEGEKLVSAKTEFSSVMTALNKLPITLSDALYYHPEAQQKGSGELFFLAFDPNACTGCGLCAEACSDQAVEMLTETPELLSEIIKKMELWEKLPDTSSDTINRLLFDKEYDSFAALMLSRNFYHGITGGNQTDLDSQTKQFVHLISAVTESLVQPRYANLVREIDELANGLSENIHSILSESLPKENFDNIARAIGTTHEHKVPFHEIINNISGEDRLKQVDAGKIKRKIALLDLLRGLKWSLTDGPTGAGRARMGVSVSSNSRLGWADQYPYNPFNSPVVAQRDEFSPGLASGIVEGQLRYLLDNLKLIRKAKLEVKNKYLPKEHDKVIAALDWESLSDDERKLVPPVFLIGDQTLLSRSNTESLGRLLTSDKPVKVFILDDLISSPEDECFESLRTSELISVMGLKKAFIYQGSMASHQSMFDGLVEGVNSMSPALFRVFIPDPDSHRITSEGSLALHAIAFNSRAFPNLKFNPEKCKRFLNDGIRVDDNPSADKDWHTATIDYQENGEQRSLSFDVTWADWAFTLKNWESHFSVYEDKNGSAVHISKFILSDSQSGTPVIYRVKDDALVLYAVSDKVVEMTRAVGASWALFRELGGSLVKFPEKLKSRVKEELKEKYDAELAKLKAEYEIKLKTQEQEQVEAIRRKLRDKLVQLAGRKK